MNELDQVQQCMDCSASLERGCSVFYQDNVEVKKICFQCSKKLSLQEYKESKRLRTRLLLDAQLEVYDMNKSPVSQPSEDDRLYVEIDLSNHKLQAKTKEFENQVWFGGLQPIIRRSKVSGVSAKPKNEDGFKVLTFCTAGRTLFTIEDNDSSITLITAEDSPEPRMGWQGVDATEENALRLIDKAISMWKLGQLEFKEDKKVGFGF